MSDNNSIDEILKALVARSLSRVGVETEKITGEDLFGLVPKAKLQIAKDLRQTIANKIPDREYKKVLKAIEEYTT